MKIDERIFNEIRTPSPNSEMQNVTKQMTDSGEDFSDGTTYINFIPNNSLLFIALLDFFNTSDEHDLAKKIRSGVVTKSGLYFAHGIGYDVIDKDLLGGNGSGRTVKKFIKYLNSHD